MTDGEESNRDKYLKEMSERGIIISPDNNKYCIFPALMWKAIRGEDYDAELLISSGGLYIYQCFCGYYSAGRIANNPKLMCGSLHLGCKEIFDMKKIFSRLEKELRENPRPMIYYIKKI